MGQGSRCWDCIHFKSREFFRIDEEIRMKIRSVKRLLSEIKKAREERRPARYWRCSKGRTPVELYIVERPARLLKACSRFDNDCGGH